LRHDPGFDPDANDRPTPVIALAEPTGRIDDDAERLLVERAKHDRLAFGELYEAHVVAVHAYLVRSTGSRDVADEVTSATFERALRALPDFEWRGAGVRPWLLRIASNELATHYRSSSRSTGERARHAAEASVDLHAPDDPADARERAARVAAIHRVLPLLRPDHRDVITLRYLGSMTPADAATAMGCSKAALAITLHRALRALRIALDHNQRRGQS
jgi:RNA polymerase sigma-70 factor, ECF subfamily